MTNAPWKLQIAEGRVFELRSKSKRYPAPCALVINDKGNGWDSRIFELVDHYGAVGGHLYSRIHNPNIYVSGIRREEFNSSRVVRRRRDLERFDADDLALIRYGLALDFSGRIHNRYSDMNIPTAVPAEWTVFWLAAWEKDDSRWMEYWNTQDAVRKLLHGAWHFESNGGSRHLGYKFGRAWATRHTGKRLAEIRIFLQRHWDGLIEQHVSVVRWTKGQNIYTEEIRRDCPALGSRWCTVEGPNGLYGMCR